MAGGLTMPPMGGLMKPRLFADVSSSSNVDHSTLYGNTEVVISGTSGLGENVVRESDFLADSSTDLLNHLQEEVDEARVEHEQEQVAVLEANEKALECKMLQDEIARLEIQIG